MVKLEAIVLFLKREISRASNKPKRFHTGRYEKNERIKIMRF